MAASDANPISPGVAPIALSGNVAAGATGAARTGVQPFSVVRVGGLLPLIPDGGPLDFIPLPTGFTQDVSDTLGDYGTPNDGMDSLLSDMMSAFGEDDATIDDFQGILGDVNIDYDSFSAETWAPIQPEIDSFLSGGDLIIGQLNLDMVPPNVSGNAPPPPTPPPSGGGGGGGGGGGNGGGGGDGGGNVCAPGEVAILNFNPDGSTSIVCLDGAGQITFHPGSRGE